MTGSLMVASVQAFFVGAAHSWLGERRLIMLVLDPAYRTLARIAFSRSVLRNPWHLTSISWWGQGGVLAGIAVSPYDPRHRSILIVIAITFAVTAFIVAVSSRAVTHLAVICSDHSARERFNRVRQRPETCVSSTSARTLPRVVDEWSISCRRVQQ